MSASKKDLQLSDLVANVARMCVRRAIRHFLRSPKTGFVVALKIPDYLDCRFYEAAARAILAGEPEDDECDYAIRRACDLSGNRLDSIVITKDAHRALLFFVDDEDISPEVALTLDNRVVLETPTVENYEIVAKELGLRISKTEAAFLATQRLQDIYLAVRPGRSVSRIVRLLKAKTAGVKEKTSSAPEDKPVGNRLEDLAGYGPAKVWGLELAADFNAWKRGELEWNDVDGGALLNGPPGCGKTKFASALANTCSVPLILGSYASWQANGHMGDMLKAMKNTFSEANAVRPCILFIDEFDSFTDRNVGNDTDHLDYKRQVVNGLLECLDPVSGREGIVVIGATNDAGKVDPALLRPGRLERVIDIPPLDAESRVAILCHYLRSPLLDDVGGFVRSSEGWTGAEIKKFAREARRAARRAGRSDVKAEDLVFALPKWIKFTSEQRLRLAVHEAGHAVVGYELRPDRLVRVRISDGSAIAKGWNRIGQTEFREVSAAMETEDYFSDTIAIFLAGAAAEKLTFGGHSAAAGGDAQADLSLATDLATCMERSFGFGNNWLADMGAGNRPLEYLRLMDADLRDAVKARLDIEFERAIAIIRSRRTTLQNLTNSLVEKLEVDVSEIAEMWDEEVRL